MKNRLILLFSLAILLPIISAAQKCNVELEQNDTPYQIEEENEQVSKYIDKVNSQYKSDVSNIDHRYKKQLKQLYAERAEVLINYADDGQIYSNENLQKTIDEIGRKLISSNNIREYENITWLIHRTYNPNAACYGEGTIMLNLGLISRLENQEQVLWSKSYYEEIGYGANARKIIQLRDGGYATVLWSGYPFLIIFDEDGDVRVVNRLEQFDLVEVHHIVELSDGSLAMLGYGFFDYVSGENKATLVLIRTDNNGELLTNTQNIQPHDFKIYPNPTDGVINIEDFQYQECILFDSVGRLITKFSKTDTIDISDFENGHYELLLLNENESRIVKIVKQ